jgi:two-component system response regulator YesN
VIFLMKVLIADDEIKVCQLITHLVDWQALGLEVTGVVNDGRAAYQFICDNKPDIVITDIRMPNFDGIELVRKSKELYPEMRFIIISGYSHFEYAQSAIKYGVEDYLLKPLKKKELEGTLKKIIEKNSALEQMASEKERLQSMIDHAEEKARKNLLADMIMNPGGMEQPLSIGMANREYHCRFAEGFYAILKMQPFLSAEAMDDAAYALLLPKLESMAVERLSSCCEEIVSSISDNAVLFIINTKERDLTEVKRQLGKMKNDVSNLREIFLEVRLVIGISSVTDDMRKLPELISEADIAVLSRISEKGKNIFEYSELRSADVSVSDLVDHKYRSALLGSLEILDTEGVSEKLESLACRLEPYSFDGKLIYGCYMELVGILQFGVKNFSMQNFDVELDFPDENWFKKRYNLYMSVREAIDGLLESIRQLFGKFEESRKMADYKPIRLAKQYINENYNTPLTLESVSATIGFNPAYFSTLFKKETNKNFSEYVMEVRIQNAKQLLIQTSKNVDDIAMEVGYSDLKYFSRLFKKITGLNPSEYRKLYS